MRMWGLNKDFFRTQLALVALLLVLQMHGRDLTAGMQKFKKVNIAHL